MKKKILTLIAAGVLLLSFMAWGCGDSGQDGGKIMSEEVSWKIGETTVTATITRPESEGPHPAIVFIAGSGPTDRDWNSPLLPGTNGSARLMAEELAEKGFVTIRYDKRFTGPYAEENLPFLTGKISMESHREEVQGAVELLRGREDVDKDRIFVLGHSEGTIHTVNYQLEAVDKKFAGIILAAPPGRSMGDLARWQIMGQLVGMPNADEILAMYDEAIEGFISTGTMEPDDSLPAAMKSFLLGLANPINMPFTQELWTADIVPLLKDIDCPVLIIIGKKDIQVDWEIDGKKLEEAAAGQDNYSFAYPNNANHVFKHEEKPREEVNPGKPGYNESATLLDAETMEIIENWLNIHS